MASGKNVDVALLKELLDYYPETGALVWKARPVSMFKDCGGG